MQIKTNIYNIVVARIEFERFFFGQHKYTIREFGREVKIKASVMLGWYLQTKILQIILFWRHYIVCGDHYF